MDADALVETSLRALETGDAALATGLFTDDATIHSPLYGPVAPRDSHPALFADTWASHLRLHGTMSGHDVQGAPLLSFFFHVDQEGDAAGGPGPTRPGTTASSVRERRGGRAPGPGARVAG